MSYALRFAILAPWSGLLIGFATKADCCIEPDPLTEDVYDLFDPIKSLCPASHCGPSEGVILDY